MKKQILAVLIGFFSVVGFAVAQYGGYYGFPKTFDFDSLTVNSNTVWNAGNLKYLTGSQTQDLASIAAQNSRATYITVTGAAVGSPCVAGESSFTFGLALLCRVSSADTVEVRAHNYTGSAIDPPSKTYSVAIFNP